jgi:hypothetical protein
MSNGARDITDIPAYYDYLVGLGFSFHIFKEEPEYDTFTSYSPRGFILPTGGSYSTARQHFIEMITEGGHGINRPMNDAEILAQHSDLTQEEITSMRAAYQRNITRRPFKLPIEITGLNFPERELETIQRYLGEFYEEVSLRKPYRESGARKNIFVPKQYSQNTTGSAVGRIGTIPGANPKPGSFWYDNREGKLFAYLNDGSGSTLNFWVEVG